MDASDEYDLLTRSAIQTAVLIYLNRSTACRHTLHVSPDPVDFATALKMY